MQWKRVRQLWLARCARSVLLLYLHMWGICIAFSEWNCCSPFHCHFCNTVTSLQHYGSLVISIWSHIGSHDPTRLSSNCVLKVTVRCFFFCQAIRARSRSASKPNFKVRWIGIARSFGAFKLTEREREKKWQKRLFAIRGRRSRELIVSKLYFNIKFHFA